MAEEERQKAALNSLEDDAQRLMNSWKRGKSLKRLIENLVPVLLPNATAPVFGMLNTLENKNSL